MNDVEEFLAHPVLAGRDRRRDVRTPGGNVVPALVPPVDVGGTVPVMGAVPSLGEHTAKVLGELGHSAADIDALHADHVI